MYSTGRGGKTAGWDNVIRFRCKSAPLASFLGSSVGTLKKAEESALCQDTSLALRKLLKSRFALEIHDIISPLWYFSSLGLRETIFIIYYYNSFRVILFNFFAYFEQVCGSAGGSRYVGGVCGCSDMEGGAQTNLKARFGFPPLQGKRESPRWAATVQILLNCN